VQFFQNAGLSWKDMEKKPFGQKAVSKSIRGPEILFEYEMLKCRDDDFT